jgi:hypothetical protein
VVIAGGANSTGANPSVKVMSLLAGMVAGADSIDDPCAVNCQISAASMAAPARAA